MSSQDAVPAPVDHATRLLVRDDHHKTLLVEAGAGTGKTTALVGRMVAMIASGAVRIDEIAAITFTEAAAGELRDRIRSGLEVAARGDAPAGGARGEPVDDVARARCSEALDHLDDAAISTLHGFAQRILAAHPLEAGLPPRFEVLDAISESIEFDARFAELVAGLHDDAALADTLAAAHVLGIQISRLRDAARALYEHHDRVPEEAFTTRQVTFDLAPVLAAIDGALAHRRSCTDDTDKLAAHLDRVADVRASLVPASAGDPIDALDVLAASPKLSSSRGQKGNWPDVRAVREACNRAEEERASLLTCARVAVLHTFAERLARFALDEARRRRREGRLSFHDLLVLANELLRSDRAVLETLRRRHRVLFVDEFQDTDPLQVDLAVLLASSEPDAGTRPWWEVDVDPGRLFLVGDPKQSIYRFRSADLAVYDRIATTLDAQQVALRQNFRSVPGVLAWVNHVFARLLGEGEPGVQAPHVELAPARDPHPAVPVPVRVIGGPDVGSLSEIRAEEAADIAATIRRAKAEGWPVVDPGGSQHPAAYRDIAILLPTRTTLQTLEDALEDAGIPARVESQSLVFATSEIRDLLSALTAIDDPTDEIALVAALRSPAFACRDTDLFEYRRGGGAWNYLAPPPSSLPTDHPVVAALGSLRTLHEARWWRSVSETVMALVAERNLLALAVAHGRPRERWRRIRFFCDQARAFDDSGHTGLRAFVEWARGQAEEGARAVEVVVPEPDDDAVRILTVHGAKGLEFPIVILAGLNVRPTARRAPVLFTPAGPELSLRVGDAYVTTPGYDAAHEYEQHHEEAEDLRLLYVAATRARDHLVVSLHHSERGGECHAARITDELDGAPCEPLAPRAGEPLDHTLPSEPPPDMSLPRRDAFLAERSERLAAAARPASVAATSLAHDAGGGSGAAGGELGGATPDEMPDGAAEPGPGRRGRAGTAIGRAVHAALQSIDLATREGLEATVRAQALAEGVADREREVRALVEHVLDTDIVQAAVGSGRYWREVPVAAAITTGTRDLVVEGFVDLLVETPEGLVVVDYKTDRVDGEAGVEERLSHYSLQGATYALALEAALGRPVARCVFVFAQPGRAIERDVPDLGGAMARVRELVAAR